MARRKVTHARKGRQGRVAGLGGPSFGYLSTSEVVERIRARSDTFYVREASYETDIHVVEDDEGVELVSTSEIISRNNLRNLPSC